MSDSELEKVIRVLEKSCSSRTLLNALVLIRKKVDWPKHRANVATLRSRGTLKRFLSILSNSLNKCCIDTTLSILGNCCMDRSCTSELVGHFNIFSVLSVLLKKYPNDDSVKGRTLRIVGNICQHSDQWAGIILNRKGILVATAVDIIRKASLDTLPDGEKISDATVITALRALRELLNTYTIVNLVEDFGVLKAVGALFIKYSTIWQTNRQNEKLLLDIVRVIHEYSKYKNYHSILDMRSTERGDSLLHLTNVLILSPKRIVKIVMNFIRSCKLKSELPIPEICTKFIDVLENHSLVKEFRGQYSEYLQCLCYLLDHPANRNQERCGKAVPLLIKVLKEFETPSNNIVECCILLINTLNKFKYDPKWLVDQLGNDIVPLLVKKLAWVVGPPDTIDVMHVCEKKRKYMYGPSAAPPKKRCIEGDLPRECYRSPPSSDDERELSLDSVGIRNALYYRSPSPCSSSSDGDNGSPVHWGPASSSSSPAESLAHDSDSDNYSPVCSEPDEPDYLAEECEDYCDPLAPVPDLDDLVENDGEASADQGGSSSDVAKPAISESLKTGLRMEIVGLIKTYIRLRPAAPQLANMDLLVQLTKCAILEKDDLEKAVCELLSHHGYLIPLLQTDFVHVVWSMRDNLPDHGHCVKCFLYFEIASRILQKITEVAESGAGKGDIAHRLLRGDDAMKRKLVTVIPYVISNRSILGKLMLNCGGLEILIDLFRNDENDDNRRTLKALCHMATYRLLIVNPRDVSKSTNRRKIAADSYSLPRDCGNVVSFVLDDGSVVEADRDFLSEKSEFFNGLLNGHFKESSESQVALSKVHTRSFRCLLCLLQSVDLSEVADIDLDLETLLDVIVLCDRYLLMELCVVLTDAVERYKISIDTLPTIYNWSVESGTNLLRVESVAFALVVEVDEKKRLSMFESLFRLGYKEQLLQDIQSLLFRFLTLSGHQQRARDLCFKRDGLLKRKMLKGPFV
ncbi:BTB/POZ domain-containing protein Rnb [Rhynchophorus ferrugineus]|uniref:BTB/POZ domain-containing protein Rnb n=1 Tax=Rhynchophorus ferrugineus TaxID=354439 RepID=UPI003FCE3265